MPPTYRPGSMHPHIKAVLTETGEDDPFVAVRTKVRQVIDQYQGTLGESPPFNMRAIASFRGLRWLDADPHYSADSEIAPESDGSVVLRVNRSRPLSRQRFSIGHEIGHTLFPEYELAVRCRKAVERTWANPNDLLETLCDVAASELMFPLPWFEERVRTTETSAAAISELASDYQGSRDATVRRFVEIHPDPLAAVFFSWKLKPTEQRLVKRNRYQKSMFDDYPLPAPTPMIRVDYAIVNETFEAVCGGHIPKDKSVASEGPIYAASISQSLEDGEAYLDLGTIDGKFAVSALPVFTSEKALGPEGGCSVVAVLRPL